MNFNKHSKLRGSHATFGASQSSWLNYTQEEMIKKVCSNYRVSLGTEMHDFASSQIRLGHKMANGKSVRTNLETFLYRKYYSEEFDDISKYSKQLLMHLNDFTKESYENIKNYINDAIGFKMTTEQPLYYSDMFFGTADAISYNNNVLRIHDLKTGVTKVHIEQLLIYAALFCLEYNIKPNEINEIELRIYQNNEVLFHNPTAEEIIPIINKIVTDNKMLYSLYMEDNNE